MTVYVSEGSMVELKPPTFQDLVDHAEGDSPVAEIVPYVSFDDYEQTIRRSECFGIAALRGIATAIAARRRNLPEPQNYRLQTAKHGFLAGAADFITVASIGSEKAHRSIPGAVQAGILAVLGGADIWMADKFASDPRIDSAIMTGGVTALAGWAGLSLLLGSPLHRYSRALTIRAVDRQLGRGVTFHSEYRNRYGIDNRAISNYYDAQTSGPLV